MAGEDRDYRDIDGNPCSLDALCRKEPAWAANRIRTADADLAAMTERVEAQAWVPVGERLPQRGQRVLVWNVRHDPIVSIAYEGRIFMHNDSVYQWEAEGPGYTICLEQGHVTHWRALPAPPVARPLPARDGTEGK